MILFCSGAQNALATSLKTTFEHHYFEFLQQLNRLLNPDKSFCFPSSSHQMVLIDIESR